MKPSPLLLLVSFPLCALLGCGGKGTISEQPQHQLLSVTISPASGTAAASGGQVQFVATGHYGSTPITVTPLQANWGTFSKQVGTTTQNGVVSCVASGTTIIEAWAMLQNSGPVCNVIDPAGMPCGTINARAEFTCP
jgi:hypothetical protein